MVCRIYSDDEHSQIDHILHDLASRRLSPKKSAPIVLRRLDSLSFSLRDGRRARRRVALLAGSAARPSGLFIERVALVQRLIKT